MPFVTYCVRLAGYTLLAILAFWTGMLVLDVSPAIAPWRFCVGCSFFAGGLMALKRVVTEEEG